MVKRALWAWAGLGFGGLLVLPAAAQQRQTPTAASKLAPVLLSAPANRTTAAAPQTLRLQVRDAKEFVRWASQMLPGVRVQPEANELVTVFNLQATQRAVLLASPLVLFADTPNRPVHDERPLNQADLTVNGITPLHRRYPALAGQGLTVSVKENPLDVNDIDFRGGW